MSHTITGKLNKAASIFQAGDSTGFGIRLGVQYYDRETKQKEWTNYEAVLFAKAPAQIDFYTNSLIENSIVEVSGESLKIKQFNGQNGLSLSIEMVNAKAGFIHQGGVNAQAQQQSTQQQPQFQQPPAPQQGFSSQSPQQQQQAYQAPQPQQQPPFDPNQNPF
jgi:hypothetical protein